MLKVVIPPSLKNVEAVQETVQIVEIDETNAGQRIDNFLIARLKGVPKSHVYRILRKGEVRVNKGRIKPVYKLKVGDRVRIPPIRVSDINDSPPVGQELKTLLEASVLYEDAQLIVINKPSGLAVHGGSGVSLGLIEALRTMRPNEKVLELVHRLDRDTSGCILIAKKKSALRFLHEQLRSGKIDKRYLALVKGCWSPRTRQVNVPLKKNELQSGERIVKVALDGKEALTEFKVIKQFQECTLVEAKPITGRTHQIRVHAQYVNHGLVGDSKYGDDEFNKVMRQRGIKRLFLHSASIGFSLPDSNNLITITAPLSEELQRVLDSWID